MNDDSRLHYGYNQLVLLFLKLSIESSKRSATIVHLHGDRHVVASSRHYPLFIAELTAQRCKKVVRRPVVVPVHLDTVGLAIGAARYIEVRQLEDVVTIR